MKTDRELLEQAHEVLWEANTILVCSNDAYKDSGLCEKNKTIRQAITARLAEDDEEPVAYAVDRAMAETVLSWHKPKSSDCLSIEPLYRRPQPKARLTDEEIKDIHRETLAGDPKVTWADRVMSFAKAIEEKIWEKNRDSSNY